MKARTKAQREVVELTATLPPFDERDLRDARRGFARIYAGAKKAWCSCCGGVWESGLWNGRKEHDVCPHCGAKGKVVKSANKRTSDEKYYVSFVRVVGDWQVIRTAICRRIVEKGDPENVYFSINEVYQSRWLDVMIRGKGITIRPLQNIREFYEEGEAMHHCVFSCGYYKKDGILVLTARKAGVRLETIEIDTKRWRILQCRGRFNKESVHHKEIVSLMEKNMNKLRQAI